MLFIVAGVAFAIGFVTARWYGVVLSVALLVLWVGAVVTGLLDFIGLWGRNVGDGWQYGLAVLVLLTVGGSAVGVATAQLRGHRINRSPSHLII